MCPFFVRSTYDHRPGSALCFIALLFALLLCGGCHMLPSADTSHRTRTADAWVAVGMAHLDQQDTVSARWAFERAQRFDDSRLGVWHGLALCAQREHKSAQAHALYQKALVLANRAELTSTIEDSEYAALLNNHAHLLYDEGAINEACAERDRAARYLHGIGSDMHTSLMHCP